MTRVGVLGVGTISSCVLHGICKAYLAGESVEGIEKQIYISTRSQSNADELAETYKENIVIKENSEIVSQCDWIIISVRPDHVETLCKDLTFREDQTILNFVSVCLSEEQARTYFAPAQKIVRISPWPCSKNRLGPVLVLNSTGDQLDNFLSLFGDVAKVDNIDQFISMQSSSCFMAPFYNALESITTWLESEHIEREKASLFVGSLVHAFGVDAKLQGSNGFAKITEESQTKGGMNEQALQSLQKDGAFDALQKALTGLVERAKNK